jgi:hypothetical protein
MVPVDDKTCLPLHIAGRSSLTKTLELKAAREFIKSIDDK